MPRTLLPGFLSRAGIPLSATGIRGSFSQDIETEFSKAKRGVQRTSNELRESGIQTFQNFAFNFLNSKLRKAESIDLPIQQAELGLQQAPDFTGELFGGIGGGIGSFLGRQEQGGTLNQFSGSTFLRSNTFNGRQDAGQQSIPFSGAQNFALQFNR